jgi:hypothetical protein
VSNTDMRRAVEIRLDSSMRQKLQSLSRIRRASGRFAERTKIVLFGVNGMGNKKRIIGHFCAWSWGGDLVCRKARGYHRIVSQPVRTRAGVVMR